MKEIFRQDNVNVEISTEHKMIHFRVTDEHGNIKVFVVTAEAAHVGCAGLRVRRADGEVGEEIWLAHELRRMY